MKFPLMLTMLWLALTAYCQNPPNKALKNDLSILYGFELNHFDTKIPGLEYRRSISPNWKVKISVIGKRKYDTERHLSDRNFTLSDTTTIVRRQYFNYQKNTTLKIGVDFVKFKNFTIGSQLSYSTLSGNAMIEDKAVLREAVDASILHDYSTKVLENYTKSQSQLGAINYAPVVQNVGTVNYRSYGVGITAEAKWPIGNYLEMALQYTPEYTFNQFLSSNITYEKDNSVEDQHYNLLEFSQYLSLFARIKF